MKELVKDKMATFPEWKVMTTLERGILVGRISDNIKRIIERLHIPHSHGVTRQVRAIRLDLASYLLDRKITTYNSVSDAELDAIAWLTRKETQRLEAWLRKNYGHQPALV